MTVERDPVFSAAIVYLKLSWVLIVLSSKLLSPISTVGGGVNYPTGAFGRRFEA